MGFNKGDFPVSENAAEQLLSLPIFPGLSAAQQNRVVEEIARFEKTVGSPLPVQPAAQA